MVVQVLQLRERDQRQGSSDGDAQGSARVGVCRVARVVVALVGEGNAGALHCVDENGALASGCTRSIASISAI
jgi:hypothetical protein